MLLIAMNREQHMLYIDPNSYLTFFFSSSVNDTKILISNFQIGKWRLKRHKMACQSTQPILTEPRYELLNPIERPVLLDYTQSFFP